MKCNILRKFHDKVTTAMAKCPFVENVLIAKVKEADGKEYDCIYCTIIRNAVLFSLVGGAFGFLIGWLV